MKKLYVILTQTGTIPAKLIKLFTKAPYNHTSITTDVELIEIWSFCRKHKITPLPAGFVNETEIGVFNMFNSVPCEIYSFDVTEEQYEKYEKMIDHFRAESKMYSYNVLGLFGIVFGIPVHRKNRFICSQFVAHILQECEIASFYKDLCLVIPDDFRHLDNATLVYQGDMKNAKVDKDVATATAKEESITV